MKILFSNVLKSPSTKLLLIAAALLFVFEANGQMPDAKNNSVVVRIDQPSIMFSFAPNYDVNFLPGYGFGAEYIFQDRVGFDLDVYRRNSDLKDFSNQSFETVKGMAFTPSFKFYLDPYSKLYVSLGTEISFINESKGNVDAVHSQQYWQDAIQFGAGYKMYLFKHRKFGLEAYIGSNLLLWSNSEPWTSALTNRGMETKVSLFYRFRSSNSAQRPMKASQETFETLAKKTNKGISVFQFNWNIDANEHFEDQESTGLGRAFNVGYGYFFADRTSVWTRVGLNSFVNKVPSPGISLYRRDFHLQFGVRRYFFKRAAFYAELGGQVGAYKRQGGDASQDTEKVYFSPLVSLGYEYLITDLHPSLDNHLGVEIGLSHLIPLKSGLANELPGAGYFPELVLQFGINYHW